LYQNGSLNAVKYLERINDKRIQQFELYTQQQESSIITATQNSAGLEFLHKLKYT